MNFKVFKGCQTQIETFFDSPPGNLNSRSNYFREKSFRKAEVVYKIINAIIFCNGKLVGKQNLNPVET